MFKKKYSLFFLKLVSILLICIFIIPFEISATDGWKRQSNSGPRQWSSIATSADGQKIVAGAKNGYIYTSTDAGVTWVERTGPGMRIWSTLASSADGTRLVAGDAEYGSNPWTSSDSGVTWTERPSVTFSGFISWNDIAVSDDGLKVIAAVSNDWIKTSTDGGVTWVDQTGSSPNGGYGIASSADGLKVAHASNYIYTSVDGGFNWTQQLASGERNWTDISSSADGTKLAAVAYGGYVYTSTDSGVTWTQQTNSGSRNWTSIDSSIDGTTLVATASTYTYVSNDSGITWTRQTSLPIRNWVKVKTSSDGSNFFLVTDNISGYVYTYDEITPISVTTGSAAPHRTSAVLSGEIVSVGDSLSDGGYSGALDRGFEYGLTDSYGSIENRNGYDSYDNDLFSTGTFSIGIGQLTCNTLYHYRAYAVGGYGTSTGSDATVMTSACTAPAQKLYGVDGAGQNPNSPALYVLDEGSGLKESTVGISGNNITGMDFHPTTGVLYGSSGGNGVNSKSLFIISTTTGATTLLGAIKDSENVSRTMQDIVFNNAGVLYGYTGSNNSLHTIDISSCNGVTCIATKVGDTGIGGAGNALAFDSNDNLYLFANYDNSFYKIDPVTGLMISEISFTNPSGESFPIAAAKFNADDVLYASRLGYGSSPADLITINISTGEITSLSPDNNDMLYMDAIAFGHVISSDSDPDPDNSESPTQESPSALNGGGGSPRSNCRPPFEARCPWLTIERQIKDIPAPKSVTQFYFNENLGSGTILYDVYELQKYLNTHGYILSDTGPGSPGNETMKFGKKTRLALIRLQKENNIEPPVGFFGPITREFINNSIK